MLWAKVGCGHFTAPYLSRGCHSVWNSSIPFSAWGTSAPELSLTPERVACPWELVLPGVGGAEGRVLPAGGADLARQLRLRRPTPLRHVSWGSACVRHAAGRLYLDLLSSLWPRPHLWSSASWPLHGVHITHASLTVPSHLSSPPSGTLTPTTPHPHRGAQSPGSPSPSLSEEPAEGLAHKLSAPFSRPTGPHPPAAHFSEVMLSPPDPTTPCSSHPALLLPLQGHPPLGVPRLFSLPPKPTSPPRSPALPETVSTTPLPDLWVALSHAPVSGPLDVTSQQHLGPGVTLLQVSHLASGTPCPLGGPAVSHLSSASVPEGPSRCPHSQPL